MTAIAEAADAAIFLGKNPVLPPTHKSEGNQPMHEFIAGNVLGSLSNLLVSETIGEQYNALTDIIHSFSHLLIGDRQFTKINSQGNVRSVPAFSALGFQHTLENTTLQSLLLKRSTNTFWQFIFRPEVNEVQVFDSSRLDHPTYDMFDSVHIPYFDKLEQAVTRGLLAHMVLTCEDIMIKS